MSIDFRNRDYRSQGDVTDSEYTHIQDLFIIAKSAAIKQNPQHKVKSLFFQITLKLVKHRFLNTVFWRSQYSEILYEAAVADHWQSLLRNKPNCRKMKCVWKSLCLNRRTSGQQIRVASILQIPIKAGALRLWLFNCSAN